jgi:predicted ferric reductase
VREGRFARVALAVLAAGNGLAVLALWALGGGPGEIRDAASALTAAGRVTGLLGAYLALVCILLVARVPVLDRVAGFDRLTGWHRWAGSGCLALLLAHAALIVAGYTAADATGLWEELQRLVTGYPGVITALAALALLVVVAVLSARAVRRRLRYETWFFTHLYTYLAIALAFSHQLATGTDFVGRPLARGYWYALYAVVLGAALGCRLLWPAARALWHDLRVERVELLAPGVVSIEVGGRRLGRLRARSGQFFLWRFLGRGFWWEAHPFSLSAAPDGRRLRITVKSAGDFTARVARLAVGTRVVLEGPFGTFTGATRRRPRVALIAGGVGITPVRALLEDLPGAPGDIAVVYRAARADDVILREELEELALRRGVELHVVLGDHRTPAGAALLSPERLCALVPDIAQRDVYVCGPPAMTVATRESLRRSGVARGQVHTERFAF